MKGRPPPLQQTEIRPGGALTFTRIDDASLHSTIKSNYRIVHEHCNIDHVILLGYLHSHFKSKNGRVTSVVRSVVVTISGVR